MFPASFSPRFAKHLMIVTAAATLLAMPAQAKPVASASEGEIMAVTSQWLKAISSGDPKQVTKLYDEKDAVLLPTLSAEVHDTPKERAEYFAMLLKRENLKGVITEPHIRRFGDDIAINSGRMTFSFTENGKTVEVPVRYTFVYHKTPKGWMIVEHHSSRLP